jgi:polyferredoxin
MVFHLLADAVLVVHAAFVAFVVAGGFLVLRHRAAAWVHVPCVLWGAWVEFSGWICPLTPLEDWLRERAGEAVSGGDFVQRWILFALYPERLPRYVQVALGLFVIALNAGIYVVVAFRGRRARTL